MANDKLYIRHILDAINEIDDYLKNVSGFEEFLENKMAQAAVVRQLEIIGEAAKRLSENLKEKYSGVPWKYVCGMRDKLIHDYFGIDIKEVWETAMNDLKDLKLVLEGCLDE